MISINYSKNKNNERNLEIISLANFLLRSGGSDTEDVVVLGFLHHFPNSGPPIGASARTHRRSLDCEKASSEKVKRRKRERERERCI